MFKRTIQRLKRNVQRAIDKLPWRRRKKPEPEPEGGLTEPALFQWVPGDPSRIRLHATLAPRGVGLATAHGHKHVVPDDQSHDGWIAALMHSPPHRNIDGYSEWDMPSVDEIVRRAQALHRPSGTVLMAFFKLNKRTPDTGVMDIAYWIEPSITYGVVGSREPVRNLDNKGWDAAR